MTVSVQIDHAADLIASAASMTERSFLEIGQRLETSATRLQNLTRIFDRLQEELTGAELQEATRGLGEVAAQVTTVAHARSGDHDLLAQIDALAAAIDNSVGKMRTEVGTIGVLTVNARIVASGLGAAGGDFLGYVAEIAPSLALTQTNLQHFDRELASVAQHLATARAGEIAFDKGHGQAVEALPPRLLSGVAVIGERRHQAAESASAVRQRASQIGARIGSAILALQVGDATRQRIEHGQTAARMFTDLLRGADLGEPAWSQLDDAERQWLVGQGCRLEAALLADAADEFERDVATVVSALQNLAADAGEIVRLGTETFTGSDGDSSFLRDLEADINQVGGVFESFRTARATADEVMGSVLDIATRLSKHIGTVRSLEADIRIMGFNTTFKCSRLGDAGRPLAVISQELRACSGRTGIAASTVTADVESIVTTARQLTGEDRAARADGIATVTQVMAASIDRLQAADENLAVALSTLAADGTEVAGLLGETVDRITVRGEIGEALRAAAAILAHMAETAAEAVPAEHDIADAREVMFAKMARRYTMAREREIHAQVIGGPTTAPVAAEGSIDDMLF
jgi:hypothetical protein